MSVLVIGSANIDYVYKTAEFVKPGNTILGYDFEQYFGGKGANQVYAASQIIDETGFIASLGTDQNANDIINHLKLNKVDVSQIKQVDLNTGCAFINIVDGENAITCISGANLALDVEYVQELADYICSYDIVVLQLEIDPKVVEYVLELCALRGVTTILDPAPSNFCTQKMIDLATYVKPNEHEYEDINSRLDLSKLENLIVTRGSLGVSYITKNRTHEFTCKPVNAIDTTGAGDVFMGVFASMLDKTKDHILAINTAIKCSGYVVTKMGAQVDFKEVLEG